MPGLCWNEGTRYAALGECHSEGDGDCRNEGRRYALWTFGDCMTYEQGLFQMVNLTKGVHTTSKLRTDAYSRVKEDVMLSMLTLQVKCGFLFFCGLSYLV